MTRGQVQAQLRAVRWQRCGSQSVATTTGPLTDEARRWAAVFEAGPRGFLDGASALQAAGLTRFTTESVRVSVPRGARRRRAPGVDIRQTRRWSPDDLAGGGGVPRARPEVAAVRAALWAVSDRQACLVVTMAVQQGVTTAERIGVELLRVRRDRRRALLCELVVDLLGGVRSLGELDFARECRRRGLPEPSRQVVRRGRGGRYYLDAAWEDCGVVVEIDGIHHGWADVALADALRQNQLSLEGDVVLRLPLLGLRVAADDFFAQIADALARGRALRRTA